jgi:uncharacterized OB-fold protein
MPDAVELSYPMPEPDETTQFFWDAVQNGELHIQRCMECGKFVHEQDIECAFCLSNKLGHEKVSGDASLYSYAVAVHSFHGGITHRLPYVVAIVELVEQEQLRMVSNVVDCAEEDLRVGMPLQVVFEEVAPGFQLPMFRPSEA